MHALNMLKKVGRQRTYGALMDGKQMILLCYDAGVEFKKWTLLDFQGLTGTFTYSRCALS